MAPKKPNPKEDPPAASSEEEEEETEREESSSEEEEDDEETPEATQLSSPPPKQGTPKKPKAAATTPQSKSSSSDDESGSESESESDPDQTPKPIATKPMEETPKATKPRSKPASKRPSETDGAEKDSKRAKKKSTEAEGDEEEALESKKPGEDTKKLLFQRLWSEDDEIAVLKGMIEFSTKKGVDPNQDMNAFHDFIKKSLHIDVSRTQLVDKIRRLRKKYENNLSRGIKKGEVRTFSKPHEQKAYDLSKKVWGGEGGVLETPSKSNGKARKTQTQRGSSKQLAASKVESVNGPKDVEKMEVDNDKELSLKTPVDVEKFLFDNSLGVAGFEDYVVKNGLTVIRGSKKTELEQRWKKLHIAQLELYVERIDLVKEQALLVLESLKSSDN
ncbi:hypothetical protein Dsin_027729 [Dipteronia sinensis]|uniref:Glabrous enhancer-binding protein-like DBD domain-containing protein n=1 Tax=Dipteronia sinensis TaxID=43782 RepID=A0AAE0DTK0_9ROSI|nr:hypothetical protein Dsin_027729 [Dipteronia sinensis]